MLLRLKFKIFNRIEYMKKIKDKFWHNKFKRTQNQIKFGNKRKKFQHDKLYQVVYIYY